MKYVFILALLASCKLEPEFYYKGNPCYTMRTCVKSHLEFSVDSDGDGELNDVCDEYRTDTIIMQKQ